MVVVDEPEQELGVQSKHPLSFQLQPAESAWKPAFSMVAGESMHWPPEPLGPNAKAWHWGSCKQIAAHSSSLYWYGYSFGGKS